MEPQSALLGWLSPLLCRLASLLFGLVYATVATQLIMDHMCKEPFRPPLLPLMIVIVACANSVLRLADGRMVAAVGVVIALVYYLWYVTTIVNQVCDFLKIKCLVITPKPKKG